LKIGPLVRIWLHKPGKMNVGVSHSRRLDCSIGRNSLACFCDLESVALKLNLFLGFLFGLITGGINNTGAVWGASDSWPTVEMQSRYVDRVLLLCFVQQLILMLF